MERRTRVTCNTIASRVLQGEHVLSLRETLFGGFPKPVRGGGVILLDANSREQRAAKRILRVAVALLGSLAKPRGRISGVPCHPLTIAVRQPEVVLGERTPLFCRCTEPRNRLLVIDGDTETRLVQLP